MPEVFVRGDEAELVIPLTTKLWQWQPPGIIKAPSAPTALKFLQEAPSKAQR